MSCSEKQVVCTALCCKWEQVGNGSRYHRHGSQDLGSTWWGPSEGHVLRLVAWCCSSCWRDDTRAGGGTGRQGGQCEYAGQGECHYLYIAQQYETSGLISGIQMPFHSCYLYIHVEQKYKFSKPQTLIFKRICQKLLNKCRNFIYSNSVFKAYVCALTLML